MLDAYILNPPIKRVVLRNFKSIGEKGVDIEFKPLTVFFGPQGSGKSNILEMLWRFSRVISDSRSHNINHLAYEEPRYDDFEEIVHKYIKERSVGMQVHISLSSNQRELVKNYVDKAILKSASIDVKSLHNIRKIGSVGWGFEYSLSTSEVYQSTYIDDEVVVKIGLLKTSESTYEHMILHPGQLKGSAAPSSTSSLGPEAFKLTVRYGSEAYKEVCDALTDLSCTIVQLIVNALGDQVEWLTPLRGDIRPHVEASGEPDSVGLRGENVIVVMSMMAGDSRYEWLWEKVREWASKFKLSKVLAGYEGASRLHSTFEDPDLGFSLKTAYAGFGAKQLLPVIVQLFWPKQKVILIEEPEISLHPESQAKLPELFYDAIKMGKQVVITTHSPILPIALSRMVKKARTEGINIKANDLIAVYEVDKDEEGTKVSRLQLNDIGYIKGWIKSFREIEEELTREWEETLPE